MTEIILVALIMAACIGACFFKSLQFFRLSREARDYGREYAAEVDTAKYLRIGRKNFIKGCFYFAFALALLLISFYLYIT